MHENMIDQLKDIIANQLDVNVQIEEIDADIPLLEDGIGLDSIAVVELITLIEEHFGLQFDEDELSIEPFQNLRTLTHFISTKLELQQ